MGIAPRFPDLKRYLKSYVLGWKNWQDEELPNLERYGKGGGNSYNFRSAGGDLERAAMSLRWHAVQAAFSQGAPKKKPPPIRVGETLHAIGEYWLLESNDRLTAKSRTAFVNWLMSEARELLSPANTSNA